MAYLKHLFTCHLLTYIGMEYDMTYKTNKLTPGRADAPEKIKRLTLSSNIRFNFGKHRAEMQAVSPHDARVHNK